MSLEALEVFEDFMFSLELRNLVFFSTLKIPLIVNAVEEAVFGFFKIRTNNSYTAAPHNDSFCSFWNKKK